MLVIIASNDTYLGPNLSRIATEAGLRSIRSANLERITTDLKRPDRMAIIDMAWEEIQQRGVLKQLVNISRITGNQVICVCPNQEEDLKKMAAYAQADKVFIRYDLETTFKDFLKMCS